MTALTSLVAEAVAEAYDFSGVSTVVDVGGGQGLLLETVLTRHPHLTGTVFDQEHAVATGSPRRRPASAVGVGGRQLLRGGAPRRTPIS